MWERTSDPSRPSVARQDFTDAPEVHVGECEKLFPIESGYENAFPSGVYHGS